MTPSRRTPFTIGRYAIYEAIASGGMASVHFARLVGPSGFARTVAAKRAHPHLARDPDFAPMFLDEARLAARIRHSNVVPTLDVLQEEGDLVIVMDYVHGESLWKLVEAAAARGERVPLGIAAHILIDALHGLHAAHDATDDQGRPLGIVHRDVSPHNILVGVDGVTRLVDFGIAKARNRLHSTRDHAVRGKYAYMAPEQASGGEVSRLTDTYAAAIVLWELLTGERLFTGKTDAETLHKCMVARVRPPSSLVPELPPAFDAIVKRGLSRAPEARYATAREMALELEACVPAVRASEVGAWVAEVAADALAARERVLVAMEREARSPPVEAPSEPVERAARTPEGVAAPVVVATPAARTPGASRRWAAGAVLLGILGLAVLLFRTVRHSDSGAPPVAASSSIAPIPVESAPPPAPAVPSTEATVAPVPPAAPIATPNPPPSSAGARAPARAPKHPKHPKGCDPPYSIDAQGREIFKPECM